jgi:hypothetical protein
MKEIHTIHALQYILQIHLMGAFDSLLIVQTAILSAEKTLENHLTDFHEALHLNIELEFDLHL